MNRLTNRKNTCCDRQHDASLQSDARKSDAASYLQHDKLMRNMRQTPVERAANFLTVLADD